jgi:hypothetical protein
VVARCCPAIPAAVLDICTSCLSVQRKRVVICDFGEADASPIASITSTTSPGDWKARAGWFVFIESKSNVWAYDGGGLLLLDVQTVNGNSGLGVIYDNAYPCAVPGGVLSRLSEPAKKKILANY